MFNKKMTPVHLEEPVDTKTEIAKVDDERSRSILEALVGIFQKFRQDAAGLLERNMDRNKALLNSGLGALEDTLTAAVAGVGKSADKLISFLKNNIFKVEVINPVQPPAVQKVELVNDQVAQQLAALLPELKNIVEQLKGVKITNTDPADAIPVVLTNKGKEEFYDMIKEMVGAASAGVPARAYINTAATFSGISSGRKVVAVAGTAVALGATGTRIKKVVVTALMGNGDDIVIGGIDVVAALATRKGTPLMPGASIDVPLDDLANIYIDSVNSGDGVSFTYFTA
jgi:hypothetical protein